MIFPPENLSGSLDAPITVRALNDGKVLINGEGSGVPIRLYHNSWFVIEGVNACCSKEDVVGIFRARVVGGDDRHVGELGRGLAHQRALALIAISAAD